jgi:hypothetical protein
METKKSKDLLTTIEALKSSAFYMVNGHGIIGFKSNVEFVAFKNATCFLNNEISSPESIQLVKDLNDAIKPVLNKYIQKAKEQLSKEMETII